MEEIESALIRSLDVLGEEGPLKSAASYSLLAGGKRFRPHLTLLIAKGAGSRSAALDAALATEYFHTASLVVDDLPCMDNELVRRGVEASHVRFGEAKALLVSYALIGGAYALIGRNLASLSSERRALVAHHVISCASRTTGVHGATGGQYYDLFPAGDSPEEVLCVLKLKTASLFEQAFVFGWLFGGGDPEQLPLIIKAAHHYGIAFQIADDISDRDEDLQRGSTSNLLLLLGEERAKQMFHVETSAFVKLLEKLGFDSGLTDLMNAKLLAQCQ